MDLTQLSQTASKAALSEGALIQQYMNDDITVQTKHGGASYAFQVITSVNLVCMPKMPKEEIGGGSIGDYAATAWIYHELELPATNYRGGRLDLNRKGGTFMNHQGVC